jgi:hypothetical protein
MPVSRETPPKETRLFENFGLASIELSLNSFMTVGLLMARKKWLSYSQRAD